jgi:hypothetical protein
MYPEALSSQKGDCSMICDVAFLTDSFSLAQGVPSIMGKTYLGCPGSSPDHRSITADALLQEEPDEEEDDEDDDEEDDRDEKGDDGDEGYSE